MKIVKTRNVKTPSRGTDKSAGIDFYVPYGDKSFYNVDPGQSVLIPSGIHAKIPAGYALIAMNKSGIALRTSLIVGACVVDEDYQGEIHLHVINVGTESCTINAGEKLVQMLLIPVNYEDVEVFEGSPQELFHDEDSQRGSGAFGSTGLT